MYPVGGGQPQGGGGPGPVGPPNSAGGGPGGGGLTTGLVGGLGPWVGALRPCAAVAGGVVPAGVPHT